MEDNYSLYVIIALVLIFKFCICGIICYRRSERNKAILVNRRFVVIERPTTIIPRSVIVEPHEITGIDNPGYGKQPPSYTSACGSNSPDSGPLPSYEEVVKSSYYPPNTKQEPTTQNQSRYWNWIISMLHVGLYHRIALYILLSTEFRYDITRL